MKKQGGPANPKATRFTARVFYLAREGFDGRCTHLIRQSLAVFDNKAYDTSHM